MEYSGYYKENNIDEQIDGTYPREGHYELRRSAGVSIDTLSLGRAHLTRKGDGYDDSTHDMQEPEKIDPKTFHPNTASNEPLGEHVGEEVRYDNQQTEGAEKNHVDVNTQLGGKIGVLCDRKVPCSCTADDCIGNNGNGEEGIAIKRDGKGGDHGKESGRLHEVQPEGANK